MRLLTISAVSLLVLSTVLWATHMPSPNPINGSFIVMCGASGVLLALSRNEVQS